MWGIYFHEEKFNLVVTNFCPNGAPTFSSPGPSQTDPPAYAYTPGTTATFTFTPYTITPLGCLPSYTCSSTPINICNIAGVSTFDTATANYTFMSTD